MARPLRIQFAGALYHVTSRGNRQEAIFDDDGDRAAFLDILAGVVGRFGWLCHAYCLMRNHYHLLTETPEPNLSRGMRQLNGVYTQRYNARHGKLGHVFQGRFKAVLIEKQSHLLEVCRYVVLNPVRAGLVTQARQWRWSSYAATAGLRMGPDFLTTGWVLTQFDKQQSVAQREYRQFVREGMGKESPFQGLIGGFILGGEQFVALCRAKMRGEDTLADVPRSEKYARRPSLEALFVSIGKRDRAARNGAIAKAHLEYGYSQKSIADFWGLHYATVSRIIAQEEARGR